MEADAEAAPSGGGLSRRRRSPASADEEADVIECSGQTCRACTAFVLADCIALGCCPCAVVSLLGLVFFKVPLVVGRRFWGLLRRKGRFPRRKRKNKRGKAQGNGVVAEKEVLGEAEDKGKGVSGVRFGENGNGEFCFGLEEEDERVWLEIYKVGQWGFGRVSFSGVA